jgi:hypothetical protein
MTIGELREAADRALARATAELKETGTVTQTFFVHLRDGKAEMYVCSADLTNSESGKDQLSRRLKSRCATGDVQAIVMTSDIFWSSLTKEQEAAKDALGLNVEQAGKAGICEVREAVFVCAETPIFQRSICQAYRREGESISLDGAPEIHETGDGSEWKARGGRFAAYWPHAATPNA